MSMSVSNLTEVFQDLPDLEQDQNIVLSYSGGFDSTILLYTLVERYGADRVKALSFDYGQRHSIELDMALLNTKALGVEHHISAMPFLGDMVRGVSALVADSDIEVPSYKDVSGDPQPVTYIPNRNMIFFSVTAAFAESHNAPYALLSVNATDLYGYWDTTPEFVDRINNVLQLNRKNQIKFLAPFNDFYKEDEALVAKELSDLFGKDILEHTWSCYNGTKYDAHEKKECGECPTCREKIIGLLAAGYGEEYIKNKFVTYKENV